MSIFFKAKIKFGDAPIAGKQCTISHDFARQILMQNTQNIATTAIWIENSIESRFLKYAFSILKIMVIENSNIFCIT